MKILIYGFLVFSGWAVLSTYIYVCKIKGFCNETPTFQINAEKDNDYIAGDTISEPLMQEQAVIPETLVIYFAFDKSDFNPDAKSDKYFNEVNTYLNQNMQARLSITGHADAIGSDEYNQALGYRRAQRMQQYFESKGMLANKVIIESKGEKEPADDNNTEAGRANNRRTVITIKK
ncbi:MAG: OmpA family protein [Bacteroidales bacterium]|nr:OmpA family protein [Bacteroidales bacterium]